MRLRARMARSVDRVILVFDSQGEYREGLSVFNDEASMWRAIAAGGNVYASLQVDVDDPSRLARQFDRFCLAALGICRRGVRCLVVVDELHLFSSNHRAPAPWLALVRTVRKFGGAVWAGSISSVDIDKAFWKNLSSVSCSRLNDANDQKRMANTLNVEQSEVAALSGHQYIERDLLTGEVTRG